MKVLAWIGLIVGGMILTPLILVLINPVLRALGVIPVGKAAPPTQVSGVFGLVILLVLIFLANTHGIGPVLLWVWVVVAGGLLIVLVKGLLTRAIRGRQTQLGTELDDAGRRSESPLDPRDINEYVRRKVYDQDHGLFAKYPSSGLCPICSKAFHDHHLTELFECQIRFEEKQ